MEQRNVSSGRVPEAEARGTAVRGDGPERTVGKNEETSEISREC